MTLNAAVTRRTYYGEKARVYDERNVDTGKRRREEAALREFLSGTKGTVLDIPVGTGHFLTLYTELGLEVVGLDVSHEMMAQAKAKVPSADLRVGDILQIPLCDCSVETAVCIRLLSLIDTDEMIAAVRELGRVATERVICSLKLGERREERKRSVTHSASVFRDALDAADLRLVRERMVREPNHKIYELVRC